MARSLSATLLTVILIGTSGTFVASPTAAEAAGALSVGPSTPFYAQSVTWKEKSCEHASSKDQRNDCVSMSISAGSSIHKASNKEDIKFSPVYFKCPTNGEGRFELFMVAGSGGLIGFRFNYNKGKVSYIKGWATLHSDRRFTIIDDHNMSNPTKETRGALKNYMVIANPVLEKVCNGSEADKINYWIQLRHNQKKLSIPLEEIENGPFVN